MCWHVETPKNGPTCPSECLNCLFIFALHRVMEQHKLSREQWEERIQVWHEEHSGTLKWVYYIKGWLFWLFWLKAWCHFILPAERMPWWSISRLPKTWRCMESTTLRLRIRRELCCGWESMPWGSTSMRRKTSKHWSLTGWNRLACSSTGFSARLYSKYSHVTEINRLSQVLVWAAPYFYMCDRSNAEGQIACCMGHLATNRRFILICYSVAKAFEVLF